MAASAYLSWLLLCLAPRGNLALQAAGAGSASANASAAAAVAVPEQAGKETFYLGSDLFYDSCSAAGACVVDGGITIGGSSYSKGIYAHANSNIKFTLGNKWERLIACLGINEGGGSGCGTSAGEATFRVTVDGSLLYQRSISFSEEPVCINVDVNNRNEMYLITEDNGDGTCDHTAWAEARVTTSQSVTKSPSMSPTASPTTASPTASPTTASPTASPTAGPAADVAAVGDPHVTNVRGRKLELHRTGNLTLLQIPREAKAAAAPSATKSSSPGLLRVDALAVQKGPNCAQSYIESLSITGQWVEARYPEAGLRRYTASPTFAAPTHPRHKSHLLLGPGVKLVIIHGETDTGISYLNFRASHLDKAEASIGGLLGEDDDDSSWAAGEELLPRACGRALAL